MTLTQVVAIGTLPNLATSSTPLASAAALFLGAGGAALMTLARRCRRRATTWARRCRAPETCMRWPSMAICPRSSRACTRYRAPVTAVIVTAGVSLLLALSGRCGAGRGERHQPDRLCLHLRSHDPPAPAAVRGSGQSCRLQDSVRSGDSLARHCHRAGDSGWRHAAAAPIRSDRAGGRRRAGRDCAVIPIGAPHSAASESL